MPSYRKSWFELRRITITGPKFARVSFGRTFDCVNVMPVRTPPATALATSRVACRWSSFSPARSFESHGRSCLRKSLESTAGRSKRFASVAMKAAGAPGTTLTPRGMTLFGSAVNARSIALSITGVAPSTSGVTRIRVEPS